MAAGLSAQPDPSAAAEHACDQCRVDLSGDADLAMVFYSSHHTEAAAALAGIIRRELNPACLLGVSAESVLGGQTEVERAPGLSILAARLPGVALKPFTHEDLIPCETDADVERISDSIAASEDLRAVFVFADPFSVPLLRLTPALNRARAGARTGTILGGVASGGAKAGANALLLDDQVWRSGLVGVSLSGDIRVDAVVSQGCRPIGENLIVTGARKNVILSLGGRPALQVVRETIEALGEDERKQLGAGLFVGRVIDEYKDRFGRDDYLIRNVMAADENHEAIVVADFFRVGQTVRLHVRDGKTAHEDLAMQLDAQQLHDPPIGALLITCNGRGTRMFGRPHHDAGAVVRAFRPAPPGEQSAKGGTSVEPATLPLAGFFAGGEIGPVGGESFLHGHTACLGLFRRPVG